MKKLLPVMAFLLVCITTAQESASYKLDEHALNSGGNPVGGVVLSSANFRITLDSIGEGVARQGLSSASFNLDGGFVMRYPPPGEVHGLSFLDKQTLEWSPEKSAGGYNLYRDSMSGLSGLGYGTCHQQELPGATTTDGDTPSAGDGYFYLVTVENRLDEEGTKGFHSNDDPRQGNVCP